MKSAATDLESYLSACSIPFVKEYQLKYQVHFKVGGVAKFFISPIFESQIIDLVVKLRELDLGFKVIGGTSNVLFLDGLRYGVVISTRNLTGLEFFSGSGEIRVGSGYLLQDFVRVALIHNLGGLEGLEGVPGSIGGAVCMNAGAYGYEVSTYISKVNVIDFTGRLLTLTKEDCRFSYRDSILKFNEKFVVLNVEFSLPVVDKFESAKKIEIFHIARHSYQDFTFPNLGSMYSVKGDFYRALFGSRLIYVFLCNLIKVLTRNRVYKFFNRRNPNNRPLNWLAKLYVGPSLRPEMVSSKSMNILINVGGLSDSDLLQHLRLVGEQLRAGNLVENEVVLKPKYFE